jgi:hypothetical protein
VAVIVAVAVDMIEFVIVAALVNGNDRVAVIDTVDEGPNPRWGASDNWKCCTSRPSPEARRRSALRTSMSCASKG